MGVFEGFGKFGLGVLAAIVALTTSVRARGGEDSDRAPTSSRQPADVRFFEQSIRPLLARKCYSCHGPSKQKGGLRLDSLEAILKGGESGPALVPGKPAESLLVEAVNYEGPEMPPTGKLPDRAVADITRWVARGAAWPAHSAATTDLARNRALASPIDKKQPPLWSLAPIVDHEPPSLDIHAPGAAPGWARNPIDRFILRSLMDHGLTPAPEADRLTLIRRVTFDLTGLPPSPEQIDAFLADPAVDAYERLVDRLLASPRYGERWGRHWLDLVRYAESDGYRQDAYRPNAWRYRDYVVRSLNQDKPYDRFLTEQLAGDELDPSDPELRIAVGFLRLGPYEYNQRDVPRQWSDILNDITDVTGELALGLSVGCARCHDHKFDPILQRDYYRLQAFFTPLLPHDDWSLARPDEDRIYQAKLRAWRRAARPILEEIERLEQPYRERLAKTAIAKFRPSIQAILLKPEQDRTPLERQLGALAYRQITYEYDHLAAALKPGDRARREALLQTLERLRGLRPADPGGVMTVADVGPVAPETVISGARKQRLIEPGVLSVLDPQPLPVTPVGDRSTGRRLALARWLFSSANPLTARVTVNRIWQDHFGRGLVGTASDFGRLGERPSHPELLDWLARRLVESGWRLKPLHRLLVTSAAYRQSSVRTESESAAARRLDPANRLLWRFSIRRLDAEELRDSMLAASGELDGRLGGPGEPASRPRRSIDTQVLRNTPDPLLNIFDAPDGSGTAPQREPTTTPTQALLLLNGEWPLARAQALAMRVERESKAGRDPLEALFRAALGRGPDGFERERGELYLKQHGGKDPTNRREALTDLAHILLNSNAFLYVD